MSACKRNLNYNRDTFVNGTNESGAYPKRWIASLVQVNCGKRTAAQLSKAGYEIYMRSQQEAHQWVDRKKKVDCLIRPMVVFIRASVVEEERLRDQSSSSNVSHYGTDENKMKFATPIPDYQIERLKFLLDNAESEVTIVGKLTVGDAVRVVSGPQKGLEGVVSEADDKGPIVGVLIDRLGYS